MLRRAPVLLLLVLLALVPGARAESLEGHAAFREGLSLEGDASMAASHGAFDLAQAVLAGAGPSLRFSGAEGYVVTRAFQYAGVRDMLEPSLGSEDPRNETFLLPAGTVENVACDAFCRVLLFAAGDGEASLSITGHAAGPLAFVSEARVYSVGAADRPTRDSFLYRIEPGWIAASTAPVEHLPTLLLEGGQARATGELVLFLAESSADWRGADGSSGRLDAQRTERSQGASGLSVHREGETRFIVLRMRDAELVAPPGMDVALYAPVPSLAVAGALRADHAQGALQVGGERVPLPGTRLEIEGRLDLRLRAEPPAVSTLSTPTRLLEGGLSGDATHVAIDGRALALDATPQVTPTALATGLSLAGLLAALVWLKLVGIPFYMRLTHASLLRNENRRRVYEAILARPGITTAEIVRHTGLAEIVVRHHLRMLEAHRHVAVRPVGKVRAHFALDGRAGPEDVLLHVALKDGTRRRIAHHLVASPIPLTQGDLAEAAGVSRRLVSHHLARLEETGLVEATGTTPRAYTPTERLLSFLAAAPLPEAR